MSKRVEEILRGMPREDLRVREDYRDDGLRVKLATHYLIGYLGNETPENNRAVYSGRRLRNCWKASAMALNKKDE